MNNPAPVNPQPTNGTPSNMKTYLITGIIVFVLTMIIIEWEISTIRKENFESGHFPAAVK